MITMIYDDDDDDDDDDDTITIMMIILWMMFVSSCSSSKCASDGLCGILSRPRERKKGLQGLLEMGRVAS
jgi:hypothetical protein